MNICGQQAAYIRVKEKSRPMTMQGPGLSGFLTFSMFGPGPVFEGYYALLGKP
jgi:hypothetical protein